MLAPNSPSARAQARTAPETTPGPASGRVIRLNVCHRLAPKVAQFLADERTQKVFVFAAIDNLWKGASGQAIQNLNLMLGLPEAEGLL